MKPIALPLLLFFSNYLFKIPESSKENSRNPNSEWRSFLSSLPVRSGPIVDYKGNTIEDQSKHYQLVNYDVGVSDLQQCADFLIRLRAEFLFLNSRKNEIVFKFTGGQAYSFKQHCDGYKPTLVRGQLKFARTASSPDNYQSLRRYLNYVYTYAGTVSLNRDLMPASGFGIGTVIITPGSPGHCMMIVDEKVEDGKRLYKLAESYMPAQTPYILKNPVNGTPWHQLRNGSPIRTASFNFSSYNLRRFE